MIDVVIRWALELLRPRSPEPQHLELPLEEPTRRAVERRVQDGLNEALEKGKK